MSCAVQDTCYTLCQRKERTPAPTHTLPRRRPRSPHQPPRPPIHQAPNHHGAFIVITVINIFIIIIISILFSCPLSVCLLNFKDFVFCFIIVFPSFFIFHFFLLVSLCSYIPLVPLTQVTCSLTHSFTLPFLSSFINLFSQSGSHSIS